ncbi:hypothetical protein BV326_05714 [Pseudomonas syringae pv. actinidiae]|nr:hypothetical protein BV326_05714 [Pseudomonas syringae pv. actinidiae]
MGKQIHLPNLQCVGDDFKPVIQHATMIGMMMVLRGRKMLHQSRIALECFHVKGIELRAGQRSPLPDVFNELTPSGRRQ